MREDWIQSTLGEVCFTTSGGTPSRRNDNYYNGSIPWVKSGELDKGIIYETEETITDEAIKNSSAKLFPKGTLLIALYGATIGKLAFLGTEATTNQAICGIFENDSVNSKYLFHYLFYKKKHLIGQGTGGAQPNISQTILKKLELPLPPLPEQRAIVAKIEQLLSELDNGIANLKLAQEQLKTYRQAVLKKAFEGELTKIKMTWSKLGKECDIIMGQSPPGTTYNNKEEGMPLINGPVEFGEGPLGKTVKGKWTTKPTKLCKKGDLILCVRGSTTGKTNIADYDACVGRGVAAIRYAKNQEYLNSYMLFKRYEIYSKGTGTTFPSVSSKELSEFDFPVCSFKEQHQIVQQIESRLSVCDKVEETISSTLQKAEALRQSILKKAFEGELLTETEIAACKKEKDWEPAEELLKRIKKNSVL